MRQELDAELAAHSRCGGWLALGPVQRWLGWQLSTWLQGGTLQKLDAELVELSRCGARETRGTVW